MRKLAAFFGFAPMVLGAIWVHLSQHSQIEVEELPRFEAEMTSNVDRAPAVAPESADWHRVYRFRREISARTSEKSIMQFDLRGSIDLAKQGEWIRASFHLDKTAKSDSVESTVPFYFSMNDQGELGEIRSRSYTSDDIDQQLILKDLALIFAYRTPTDTAGDVQIKIRISAKQDVIQKQKIQYKGLLGSQVKIKKSDHRIKRDLSVLAGVEVTEMNQIETLSKYQVRLVKSETLNESIGKVEEITAMTLMPPNSALGSETERPLQSWEKLKPTLSQLNILTSEKRMAFFHEVIRTLKKDPKALADFRNWMADRRKSGFNGHEDFLFGLGTLSAVGSTYAQSEMVRFYHDSRDSAILNAFTTMNSPVTPETRDFLKDRAQALNYSEWTPALFALGSSIRTDEDEGTVNLILNRYRQATNVSEKMEILDAMGNSGSDRFLSTLVAVIQDKRSPELLVTKAIFAMRLMKSSDARATLTQMQSDRNYETYKVIISSTMNYLPSKSGL